MCTATAERKILTEWHASSHLSVKVTEAGRERSGSACLNCLHDALHDSALRLSR